MFHSPVLWESDEVFVNEISKQMKHFPRISNIFYIVIILMELFSELYCVSSYLIKQSTTNMSSLYMMTIKLVVSLEQ